MGMIGTHAKRAENKWKTKIPNTGLGRQIHQGKGCACKDVHEHLQKERFSFHPIQAVRAVGATSTCIQLLGRRKILLLSVSELFVTSLMLQGIPRDPGPAACEVGM